MKNIKIKRICWNRSFIYSVNSYCLHGEVSERPKEHGWKPCVAKATEGSNPSLSEYLFALILRALRPPGRCVSLRQCVLLDASVLRGKKQED